MVRQLTRFGGFLSARIAPWRFVLFLAVVVLASALKLESHVAALSQAVIGDVGKAVTGLQNGWWQGLADALVLGFDLGVLVFALSLWPLGKCQGAAAMRQHAEENDANRSEVLILSVVVSVALLLAMLVELPEARKGDVMAKAELVGTLALGWLYTNLIFALHYAHMHYLPDPATGDARGGFEFPGTPEPDFWDFLYFSFTAGMSFAASDVNVRRGDIRRVLVGQSLLSFVFNIGALAFCINVLAGAAG